MAVRHGRTAKLEMRLRRRAGTDRLGEQLVEEGLVTQADLERALLYQRRAGLRIGEALFELGLISSPDLARVLAQRRGIPFVDLDTEPIDPEVARILPISMALRRGILPVAHEADTLVLAMVNPEDGDALASTRGFTAGPVRAVMCDPTGLVSAVDRAWEATAVDPTGTRDSADRVASEIWSFRSAVERLDASSSPPPEGDVLGWREQLLVSAHQLVDFLIPDVDAHATAAAFTPGWPGELVKIGEALTRLAAQRSWLFSIVGASQPDRSSIAGTSPARVADLCRDLNRVLDAFLATLPPHERTWFEAEPCAY